MSGTRDTAPPRQQQPWRPATAIPGAPPPGRAAPPQRRTFSEPDNRQRRWTIDALKFFGLRSAVGTERVLANSLAVAERLDDAAFQPGKGDNCAASLASLPAGKLFSTYLGELDKFERMKPPRTAQGAANLKTAAQAVLDEYQDRSGKKVFGMSTAPKVTPDDKTKRESCEKTLAMLAAYDLKAEVQALAAGAPLDSAGAMRAAAASVTLDLLSLPPNQQQARVLGGAEAGVNKNTFWINKTDADGAGAKSFICKPMIKPGELTKGEELGIPPSGGEVAREALVGRASEVLSSLLPLDLDMPETHVVAVGRQFFPDAKRGMYSGTDSAVIASVQEVRPGKTGPGNGPIGDQLPSALAAIPKSKSHALAILDMVTLNGDRHGDNLLMTDDAPVPIDHGLSLGDPTMEGGAGPRRVASAMATNHNVLLSVPSAHAPMDPAMLAAFAKLSPGHIKGRLQDERDTLEQAAPAMKGKVTNAALDPPRLAATFLKLAAEDYPQLSPATLQVAMGKNAPTLFAPGLAPREFNACANRILAEAVANQGVIREVCLLNGAEAAVLQEELTALGWKGKPRDGAPMPSISCDPALVMKIVAGGIRADSPAKLDMTAEPDVLPKDYKTILQEIEADRLGFYQPAAKVLEAAKRSGWDMAAEAKAHRALQNMPHETVLEVRTFGLVEAPNTPTKLLAQVARIGAVRFQTRRNEGGDDPLASVLPKLLDIKLQAATAMAGWLPPAGQQNVLADLQAAAASTDPLAAVTAVGADILETVLARIYALADTLPDPQATKYVRDAAKTGNIKVAIDMLADVGVNW